MSKKYRLKNSNKTIAINRSKRQINKPTRFTNICTSVVDYYLQGAMVSGEIEEWKGPMHKEIDFLRKNST